MRFRVNRADERPLYRQIVDEVRSSLLLGLLQTGDRLPAVRELADELHVSLHTVRQAYSTLAEQGILDVRRGAGTHVRDFTNTHSTLDRDRLLREIAERALHTANRHGFNAGELVGALRRADMALTPAAWTAPPLPRDDR